MLEKIREPEFHTTRVCDESLQVKPCQEARIYHVLLLNLSKP